METALEWAATVYITLGVCMVVAVYPVAHTAEQRGIPKWKHYGTFVVLAFIWPVALFS